MTDYRIDGEKVSLHPGRVAALLAGETVFPLYVEISPSGGCDSRCTFCATAFISGYQTRFLDADLLKTRLTEMGQLGVRSVMHGGSGEPLLHRRLGEVIAHGKAAGVDQAVTTNAVALTERFCQEALTSLTWVKCSVNGGTRASWAAVHRTAPSKWDRIWENLDRAVKLRAELGASVTLGVQCVVIPDNAETVLELIARARDTGLAYCVLKPYSDQPKTPTPYRGLAYDQYADLFQRAEAESTEDFAVIVRHQAAKHVVAADREYDRCLSTGNLWAYLETDWNLYSCSAYVGDERFRLGNLQDQTFDEIWMSDKARSHARWVNEEMDCSVCRKGCRQDPGNRFLWRLKHPEAHDNFT